MGVYEVALHIECLRVLSSRCGCPLCLDHEPLHFNVSELEDVTNTVVLYN